MNTRFGRHQFLRQISLAFSITAGIGYLQSGGIIAAVIDLITGSGIYTQSLLGSLVLASLPQ